MSRARSDRRRPLLGYLDRHLSKALKKAALDDKRQAYEIVEDSTCDYLDRCERMKRRLSK
jgi:hypothetical protein